MPPVSLIMPICATVSAQVKAVTACFFISSVGFINSHFDFRPVFLAVVIHQFPPGIFNDRRGLFPDAGHEGDGFFPPCITPPDLSHFAALQNGIHHGPNFVHHFHFPDGLEPLRVLKDALGRRPEALWSCADCRNRLPRFDAGSGFLPAVACWLAGAPRVCARTSRNNRNGSQRRPGTARSGDILLP